MFVCSYDNHISKLYEGRILVPLVVREVEYIDHVTIKDNTKTVYSKGFEILLEKPYCFTHSFGLKPEVAEAKTITHTFKVKLPKTHAKRKP